MDTQVPPPPLSLPAQAPFLTTQRFGKVAWAVRCMWTVALPAAYHLKASAAAMAAYWGLFVDVLARRVHPLSNHRHQPLYLQQGFLGMIKSAPQALILHVPNGVGFVALWTAIGSCWKAALHSRMCHDSTLAVSVCL